MRGGGGGGVDWVCCVVAYYRQEIRAETNKHNNQTEWEGIDSVRAESAGGREQGSETSWIRRALGGRVILDGIDEKFGSKGGEARVGCKSCFGTGRGAVNYACGRMW